MFCANDPTFNRKADKSRNPLVNKEISRPGLKPENSRLGVSLISLPTQWYTWLSATDRTPLVKILTYICNLYHFKLTYEFFERMDRFS
jgi:hypothetical protein